MNESLIMDLLTGPLPAGVIAGLVIFYLAFNPHKAERIALWFFRAFSWCCRKWRFSRTAMEIQAAVNTVGQAIDMESGGALPHAMKIEWVKEKDPTAFVRDDCVVVRLRADTNDDASFVNSTMLYLSRGLLPESRIYSPPEVVQALDFTMFRKLAVQSQRHQTLNYFFENVYKQAVYAAPQVEPYMSSFQSMDDAGIFTRLLLRELSDLGTVLRLRAPDQLIRDEVAGFAHFVATIAEKEPGEDVELTFDGKNIRTGVVLVAREEVISDYGTSPHESRLSEKVARGSRSVYICSIGDRLAQRFRSPSLLRSTAW